MGKELLFEIGTEEIPSGYLPPALEDLKAVASRLLAEQRLTCAELRTLGTPRRLTLFVDGLIERQADQRREVVGPPKAVAFDAEGKPTKAAEGFARAQGVPVDSLQVRALDRGEYLVAVQEEKGARTREILVTLLPKLITALSFPKFMRWGEGTFRFVRPIRWLLALYDGRVVPFEVDGLKTGMKTYGHRFLAPRGIRIRSFQEYLDTLEERFVIVDPVRRRELVRTLAAEAAAAVDGRPVLDEALVETVADLVEFPTAVCGAFKPEYLELPREVIVTPMQKHQRYFPVVDAAGGLLPYFVTIANMRAKDMQLIREGNERVLRARLNDAEFFFREDRKRPLPDRLPDLRQVIFQEKLGSVAVKVERIQRLAAWIAERVDPATRAAAERAALLCKADLTTNMVKEFPNLQGVMGREYARLSGEPPEVCQAIEEHYLPRFTGDRLPASAAGAAVALADRLDSIVGCFGVGLVPTGSEDPYALRRAALGVVQTILQWGFRLSLDEVVAAAQAGYGDRSAAEPRPSDETCWSSCAAGPRPFCWSGGCPRMWWSRCSPPGPATSPTPSDGPRRWRSCGARRISASWPRPSVGWWGSSRADFSGRWRQAAWWRGPSVRFTPKQRSSKAEVDQLVAAQDYLGALRRIAALRPMVDMFFEEVLVIGPDEGLTQNRFALLKMVGDLFARIADFTKING